MSRRRCYNVDLADGRAFEITRLPGRKHPVLLASSGASQGWSVAARFTSDEAADAIAEILGVVADELGIAEAEPAGETSRA